MKRRTFFLIPALMLPSLALSGRVVPDGTESLSNIEQVLDQLKSFISSPSELAKIGDSYLRFSPNLKNHELLLSQMGVDTHSSENVVLFEKQRAKDFETGNTVSVEGWILSKAEISLCCAVYLSSRKV